LVYCYCPLSSGRFHILSLVLGLASLTRACARSKQARVKEARPKTKRSMVLGLASLLTCDCLKSISMHSICIFFTSKPIHELRLDLNVANTVIALTIRVIYLSLIITLKRGVVVLWFTVTVHYHLGSYQQFYPPNNSFPQKLPKVFPTPTKHLNATPTKTNDRYTLPQNLKI